MPFVFFVCRLPFFPAAKKPAPWGIPTTPAICPAFCCFPVTGCAAALLAGGFSKRLPPVFPSPKSGRKLSQGTSPGPGAAVSPPGDTLGSPGCLQANPPPGLGRAPAPLPRRGQAPSALFSECPSGARAAAPAIPAKGSGPWAPHTTLARSAPGAAAAIRPAPAGQRPAIPAGRVQRPAAAPAGSKPHPPCACGP